MKTRQPMQRRVLVTGGAGFIGANLCRHLVDVGDEVVCLDNLATGRLSNLDSLSKNVRFRFIRGDVEDFDACRAAMQGVQVVFHQAALGSVPRSISDPLASNASNVTGFLNVLEAARVEGVGRFVYASSSSVYGDTEDRVKTEGRTGRPLSPYAVTKAVNESYAEVYSRLHGIKTIGLRYFNVFGPLQRPDGPYAAVIPKFIELLRTHEQPTIHGDGEQSRDFTYVENVVRANARAAVADLPGIQSAIVNIACGVSTTLNQLLELLRTLLAERDPAVGSIHAVHGPDRPGDVRSSLASIDRARSLLDYQPEADLRSGLGKTIAYFLGEHGS